MLPARISQSASNVKTQANNRQKRYTLAQKAEFISYLFPQDGARRRPNLSWYAMSKDVSRTTLYQIAHEFQQRFGTAGRPGPKGKKNTATGKAEVAAERKVTITELRVIRSILQMAVGPMSSRDIQQQLLVDFDLKISQRKIKKIIVFYSRKAAEILKSLGVEARIKNLSIDEIFCASDVILTGVDLRSMALVICKPSANRDHKTWNEALALFTNLELVSSDRGTGIVKCMELRPGIVHQFDLFHFKRDAHKQLRRMENFAYSKIVQEYRAQERVVAYGEHACDEWKEAYIRARAEASAAIRSYDKARQALDKIDKALEIWDCDGNLCDPSKNLKALDQGADLLAEASADQRIQNLAAQVRDPRLHMYLRTLQRRLLSIAVRYNHGCQALPRNKLFGIIASHWYWQRQKPRPVSSAGLSKGERRVARERACKELLVRQMAANFQLRQVQMMLANFDEVCSQVEDALDNVFRASSLVEAINSQLRLFHQVKKNLSKDFLALIALYWNMHPFSDGKRKNRSPFQMLGLQGPYETWLDRLLN